MTQIKDHLRIEVLPLHVGKAHLINCQGREMTYKELVTKEVLVSLMGGIQDTSLHRGNLRAPCFIARRWLDIVSKRSEKRKVREEEKRCRQEEVFWTSSWAQNSLDLLLLASLHMLRIPRRPSLHDPIPKAVDSLVSHHVSMLWSFRSPSSLHLLILK